MTTLAKLKMGLRKLRLVGKSLPEPERLYGQPREMTGFLATLTEEQRKRVLAYKGPDAVGDPALMK